MVTMSENNNFNLIIGPFKYSEKKNLKIRYVLIILIFQIVSTNSKFELQIILEIRNSP